MIPAHKPRRFCLGIPLSGLLERIWYLSCGVCTLGGMRQTALQGKCGECGRIFDLTDNNDARDWYYGHDCEDNNDNEGGLS